MKLWSVVWFMCSLQSADYRSVYDGEWTDVPKLKLLYIHVSECTPEL